MGNRRCRGFVDFLDLDDDEQLDGEGWAELAGGRQPWLTGGRGGTNK